jgi:hypothetical protein
MWKHGAVVLGVGGDNSDFGRLARSTREGGNDRKLLVQTQPTRQFKLMWW